MLAEMAVNDPKTFASLVQTAAKALPADAGSSAKPKEDAPKASA
jgi:hypothetical protein